MSKELKEWDERLQSPSFNKEIILRKLKEGISDIAVHSLLQPELVSSSILLLYCLRKVSNILTKISLYRPEIETDEDYILHADRSSHILKIAKALLEPSEFNINLVKRAFDQLEIDNEYIKKQNTDISLELYLKEVEKQEDFLLYETVLLKKKNLKDIKREEDKNKDNNEKTKEQKTDNVEYFKSVPLNISEQIKSKKIKKNSVIDNTNDTTMDILTDLNELKDEIGSLNEVVEQTVDDFIGNDKSEQEKKDKTNSDEESQILLKGVANIYTNQGLMNNMTKEEKKDIILKPTGAKWGKNISNTLNDYSAIKDNKEKKDKKKEKEKNKKRDNDEDKDKLFIQVDEFDKL